MYFFKRMRHFLGSLWLKYICAFVLIVIATCLSLYQPILSQKIIDLGIVAKNMKAIILYCGIFFGINFVELVFVVLKRTLLVNVAENMKINLRRRLEGAITRSSFLKVRTKETGDIMTRIVQETGEIVNFYIEVIPSFFIQACVLVIGVVLLWHIDYKRTYLIGAFLPLIFLAVKHYAPKIKEAGKEGVEITASLTSLIEQIFNNLLLLKQSRVFKYSDRRVEEEITSAKLNAYKQARYNICLEIVMSLLILSPIFIMYFWCGKEAVEGAMTFGTILAISKYFNMLITPVVFFAKATVDLQHTRVLLERYEELAGIGGGEEVEKNVETLDLPTKSLENIDGIKSVCFNKVCFSYGEKHIFKNLSFELRAGEKLQIKGKNGSGKSTLINLLAGILTPQEGEILINGNKLSELVVEKVLTVVPQGSFFFEDTVENNVLLGRVSLKEKLLSLGEELKLKDVLVGDKVNLEQELVSKGSNLSGGQAQKLNILRALLPDVPLVIFDEVDTYLDVETKCAVYNYVNNHPEKTFIFISHEPIEGIAIDKILEL